MNLHHDVAVPADRRDRALHRAFAGEVSVREAAAIARKTDSAPPHVICPWCPDFDPTDATLAGVSHQICEPCAARLNAEIDRDEASRSVVA